MELWEICKETGKTFTSFRGFLNHLRTLKMTSKEYYDKHHKKDDEGQCLICKKVTRYHGFAYKNYCSDICYTTSDIHKEIVSNRFVKNPSALESYREKICALDIDYDAREEKRKDTIRKKCESLGISEYQYYSNHSKKAAKSISPEKRENAVKKGMATRSQNGNLGCKSNYRKYDFFGDIVSLQGYEPIVLDSLINDFGLNKNEICLGKGTVPIIKYHYDNKSRMYFPDFYLPKSNLIVEVKSTYTLEMHFDRTMKKCEACLANGYNVLLLILDKTEARKRKLEGSKKLLDWAISSQAPKPTWYGEGSTTILLE